MSVTPTIICGTGANATGVGTDAWTNPTEIENGVGSNTVFAYNIVCLPAGTLISMADKSTKAIEDIVVGDVVTSFCSVGTAPNSVLSLFNSTATRLYQIETSGGLSVQASPEHPFYTALNNMTPASELNVGDALYVSDLATDTISNITTIDGSVAVYNFEVENNHSYFANGFAVHNVGGCSNVPTDNIVSLIVGGTISGSNLSAGASLPSTWTTRTYGSSSNLWGLTPSASQVRASNFGLAYSTTGAGTGTSEYLEATNYGLPIPANASINGIQAGIDCQYGSSNKNPQVQAVSMTVTYVPCCFFF